MANPIYPQAHLDALAQQQGFKNYAQWQAWNAQRQGAITPSTGMAGQQQPQNNWLENLLGKIPIHPIYLLNKVNDAFTQAGQ